MMASVAAGVRMSVAALIDEVQGNQSEAPHAEYRINRPPKPLSLLEQPILGFTHSR
jgi:hypothetical protein